MSSTACAQRAGFEQRPTRRDRGQRLPDRLNNRLGRHACTHVQHEAGIEVRSERVIHGRMGLGATGTFASLTIPIISFCSGKLTLPPSPPRTVCRSRLNRGTTAAQTLRSPSTLTGAGSFGFGSVAGDENSRPATYVHSHRGEVIPRHLVHVRVHKIGACNPLSCGNERLRRLRVRAYPRRRGGRRDHSRYFAHSLNERIYHSR